MAQLLLRKLDESLVQKHKEPAAKNGVSTEEKRRILNEAMNGRDGGKSKMSFKEFLMSMPDVGNDKDFARIEGSIRDVDLSDQRHVLLDTFVLSEFRKKERCHPSVLNWVEPIPSDELWLNVLVVGEIRKGLNLIQRRDLVAASNLEKWLACILQEYEGRILPITMEIMEEWGRLNAVRPLSAADSLLAATANVHELTLVTRKARHFSVTALRLCNPFD